MAEDDENKVCQQGETSPTRRRLLVSTCRRHQRSLHTERHGMRETRTAHTIPQHARSRNGRPRLRRTPTDIPDDAQHLRPPASWSTQSHSRRRDRQPRPACQHHHLINALRRTQVLQERTLQRHLRTRRFLLQATPRTRRTNTTPRQVRRRLLQAPRRIPRPTCHLQGTLHHPSAQPTHRPARCRHGFPCRPRRRRHPMGHLQACSRLRMESRMPPLGAQQPDVDKAHGQPRRMARLPRHLVQDAGLCRHARPKRKQRQRNSPPRAEESARRPARLVQRGSA